jgi:hypothetical protein
MKQAGYSLHPIKLARFEKGRLVGHGYALADFEALAGSMLQFTFRIAASQSVSFVFGFQGVGQHYRCDIQPSSNLVILHWFRDGIPVYLQHASIRIELGKDVIIRWSLDAIRIFRDDVCFINVLAGGIPGGHWGFATGDQPLLPPAVEMKRLPSPHHRWVVLGDGYSNNRWKNRHFFSWPELAFGHRVDYLNACVAAGNTRRVLQVIESITHQLDGAVVLIAAGADDFIEGEPLEDSITRLTQVIDLTRRAGATSIHLCAIPPRARNNEEVRTRNQALKLLASTVANGFIDFHAALEKESSTLIINGDYPGAEAQLILARTVLCNLEITQDLAPLHHTPRPKTPPLIITRFLHCLSRKIDSILGRMPSAGVS